MSTPLYNVMAKIREMAEEEGQDPNEFAVKMTAEVFGDVGARFGAFMAEHADPVEALAWIMIETTKREKQQAVEASE